MWTGCRHLLTSNWKLWGTSHTCGWWWHWVTAWLRDTCWWGWDYHWLYHHRVMGNHCCWLAASSWLWRTCGTCTCRLWCAWLSNWHRLLHDRHGLLGASSRHWCTTGWHLWCTSSTHTSNRCRHRSTSRLRCTWILSNWHQHCGFTPWWRWSTSHWHLWHTAITHTWHRWWHRHTFWSWGRAW